jgi:hypothetical protein
LGAKRRWTLSRHQAVDLGEEHSPRVVVPAYAVRYENDHVLLVGQMDDAGPQQRLRGQGENMGLLPAHKHFEPALAGRQRHL